MPSSSTPLQKPLAENPDAECSVHSCPESLNLEQTSGLFSGSSKDLKANERPDEKAPNVLAEGIQRLHVVTPASKTNMYSSSMNRPTQYTTNGPLTPPTTPKSKTAGRFSQFQHPTLGHRRRSSSDFCLDIKNIEFDTTHAQLLGSGLWSKVYKLNPSLPSSFASPPLSTGNSRPSDHALLTPPTTPQKLSSFASTALPRAIALKVASRSDALPVFESEARTLTHLQKSTTGQQESAEAYIIPFYGLSIRSKALIFQACNAGTLEDLINSSRAYSPAETLNLLITLAPQLISGLAFMHAKGVVHADIKPANILVDRDEETSTLKARFADFSASFIWPPCPSDSSSPAIPSTQTPAPPSAGALGGTWAFMAPEQLSRDPNLSKPSFASDVYSLSITLLSLLIGGDPFKRVANNLFLLREAVKMGNVLGFALGEPEFEDRVARVQEAVDR
ncbi:kinase-like domain-containing protein [Delphinella strobiligena]|nr:kinase-like domain-containing protein [Delphinella strobiligena]